MAPYIEDDNTPRRRHKNRQNADEEGAELDLSYESNGRINLLHDQSLLSLPYDERDQRDRLSNLNLSAIRKEVSFGNIKVRTYPICPGDNPACTNGLPLAIGWEHLKEYNFTVDYYERKLEKWASNPDTDVHRDRYPRKSEEELRISSRDRLLLLQTAGFLLPDMKETIKKVNSDRRKRDYTLKMIRFLKALYILECLRRAALNASFKRKAKKEERYLLMPYKRKPEPSTSRLLSFVQIFKREKLDKSSFHKTSRRPWLVVDTDTVSEGTSLQPTPTSQVSYNGEALFPPTPTTGSPLAKAIRDLREFEMEPRHIDMTGQITTSPSRPLSNRSPTVKVRNVDSHHHYHTVEDYPSQRSTMRTNQHIRYHSGEGTYYSR
jgi:hypothetical protein